MSRYAPLVANAFGHDCVRPRSAPRLENTYLAENEGIFNFGFSTLGWWQGDFLEDLAHTFADRRPQLVHCERQCLHLSGGGDDKLALILPWRFPLDELSLVTPKHLTQSFIGDGLAHPALLMTPGYVFAPFLRWSMF